MKLLRCIADYWFVPLLVLGAVAAMCVLSRKGAHWSATKYIDGELRAIDTKRHVRDMQIQHGADAAKRHVRFVYAEKLQALDSKAEVKVQQLENDPAALAKYLEKLSRG